MSKILGPVLEPTKRLRTADSKVKKIILRSGDTGKTCPDDMDYCYQCGYVAKREVFLKENKCPNLRCPSPHLWDD